MEVHEIPWICMDFHGHFRLGYNDSGLYRVSLPGKMNMKRAADPPRSAITLPMVGTYSAHTRVAVNIVTVSPCRLRVSFQNLNQLYTVGTWELQASSQTIL